MKFRTLLKKELSQLLTKQAIISLLATVAIYIFLGTFVGSAMEKMDENFSSDSSDGEISVICCDNGDFVNKMFDDLRADGKKVTILSSDTQMPDWQRTMDEHGLNRVTVIPEGFSERAVNADPENKPQLRVITRVKGTGLTNMIDDVITSDGMEDIEKYLRDYYSEKKNVSDDEYKTMSEPIETVNMTSANGRVADIDPASVSGILMSINMIMPMAIFLLLLMASSMIMTAISTEKIDKTLETLMSAPVSRLSVLAAKVLAAIITALINSVVMILGFGVYIGGMMSGHIQEFSDAAEEVPAGTGKDVLSAMSELGISLSGGSIALIFLELFITLAIGLCISLIVGAMATDAQSLQTLLMPIMFMTMIPFFVTMFMDINDLGIGARVVMFLIPFSHAYTAAGNIIFGHTGILIGGLVYQLVFLAGTMYAAVKVFTTDLLFTMKLPERAKTQRKSKSLLSFSRK